MCQLRHKTSESGPVTSLNLKLFNPTLYYTLHEISGVPRNFVRGGVGGGVQQIQFRTEDRENGDLGAVAPSQGLCRQL
jgi:hypothetical protein